MSVTLTCDAPDCSRTTPAVVSLNRCAAPEGWWMQVTRFSGENTSREQVSQSRLIVACCGEHFNAALHAQAGQASSPEE
jgi:hypothetical protein